MSEWLLVTLVALTILVGIVGTIVPVIPGLLLSWAGILAYALTRGFGVVGWIVMAIVTALLGVGTYCGFRIPQRDAAAIGVTKKEQLFALAVGIVGFFVVPIVGLPLGFVVGVYAARRYVTGDATTSWESTLTIVGSLLKAAWVQALFGMAMGAVWAVWVIVRAVG